MSIRLDNYDTIWMIDRTRTSRKQKMSLAEHAKNAKVYILESLFLRASVAMRWFLRHIHRTLPSFVLQLGRPENWADLKTAADMLRQLATEKAELEKDRDRLFKAHSAEMLRADKQADRIAELEKQTKPLSDEVLNKAFDYYCETDEGVLRFNYELRDEWKKEQLIRWKEAI